jgi:hydrogenase maturation factor HypF (carbamoyltransferase family)
MKLKITITGPSVHNVGYRPCLTEIAVRLALRGFEVYNDDEDGQQAVIALVEGDEQRTTKFYNSTMLERPALAKADNVRSEDYNGDVMPLWQFASINTASQMNKAIPILMAVQENIYKIKEDTSGMREDIPGYVMQFRQMQADVKAIKERLGM